MKPLNVVVIGAGIVGCSTAQQLAQAGHHVTVVDKAAAAGHGSTSASSGVVRFNYTTFDAVALAWEARHAWGDWRSHLGAADSEPLARFHQVGMLMTDVPIFNMQRSVDLFIRAGIPHRVVDAAGMAELVPGIDTGRYWPNKRVDDPAFWHDAASQLSGMFTPDGGYVDDPALAAHNMADAARRAGATFRFRTEVTAIQRVDGRVNGVRLGICEVINADVVLNAAGPWSAAVNRMAGAGSDFTVTLAPMRQEVHHVPAPRGYGNAPVIGDLDLGTYFRPDGAGGLLVGGTEPECDPLEWVDDPDEVGMAPTQAVFEAQVTRAARRLPDLGVPGSPSGIVGVYDVSSDWSPIYDKTDVPGFYLAAGTSGNQFKNAPVIGQVMRALIEAVEGGHDHDVDPVVFLGPRTGLPVNLGTFSRKRERNPDSSGTVMG